MTQEEHKNDKKRFHKFVFGNEPKEKDYKKDGFVYFNPILI
jgi:hypothetical protein